VKVSRTDVEILWRSFVSGGTNAYQKIANQFQTAQAELWNILKQLDANSFSPKTNRVVGMARSSGWRSHRNMVHAAM